MPIQFKATIQKANLELFFARVENLKRQETPLRQAVKWLEAETRKQFETETDPSGARWKDLKPSTLARKQGDKIGTDSGRMKRSLFSKVTKSGRSEIGFTVPYAQFFDKDRILVGMSEERNKAIAKIFDDYIAANLKK